MHAEDLRLQQHVLNLRGDVAVEDLIGEMCGATSVSTWEEFRERFLAHFGPTQGRKDLCLLKHTRLLADYIQDHALIIEGIPDMSDEERRDSFWLGLRHELRLKGSVRFAETYEEVQRKAEWAEQKLLGAATESGAARAPGLAKRFERNGRMRDVNRVHGLHLLAWTIEAGNFKLVGANSFYDCAHLLDLQGEGPPQHRLPPAPGVHILFGREERPRRRCGRFLAPQVQQVGVAADSACPAVLKAAGLDRPCR